MRNLLRGKGFYRCLLISVLFIFMASWAEGATWVTEAVDAPKYFAGHSPRAIAIDSNGNPHIVYGGDNLYHVYYKRGKWRYETVDSSPGVGKSAEIAIDSRDKVHISYSYSDGYYGAVKYATNASGSWITETVDTSSEYRWHYTTGSRSIAVDVSGKVHMSYNLSSYNVYNGLTFVTKYATNASGSWVIEPIGRGGRSSSIAVDSSGKAHIIQNVTNGSYHIEYATNESGIWVTETVAHHASGDISIAVDSLDNVHISYVRMPYNDDLTYTYDLKYATNATGSWVTEIVETGDGEIDTYIESRRGVGLYVSIAVDSADKAHISYYDTNGNIKHATNATDLWMIEAMDNVDAQSFTSISLDSSDKAHISYDTINGDLIYATNVSGSWIPQSLDNGSDVGRSASIAVDPSDRVHISYYDATNRELKYATNASGSWVVETLDSGNVGTFNSIAVDSSGKAHISYSRDYVQFYWYCWDTWDFGGDCEKRLATIHDLKYASNASGSWVTETLDSSGKVKDASIAVDSSDNLHIVYNGEAYSYLSTYTEYFKYITNASGSWETETIHEFINVSSDNLSIAADSSGKVHVSYNSYGLTHYYSPIMVVYLTNASGLWSSEGLDAGHYPSIAVDSGDNVHISYHRYENYSIYNDLAYITNASGSWVTDTIENAGDGNDGWRYRYISIAIDASDMAHIAYYDSRTEELKYATNASGLWSTETVDSEGDTRLTSIALDSGDNAHIGYYDTLNHDLKYATNSHKRRGRR